MFRLTLFVSANWAGPDCNGDALCDSSEASNQHKEHHFLRRQQTTSRQVCRFADIYLVALDLIIVLLKLGRFQHNTTIGTYVNLRGIRKQPQSDDQNCVSTITSCVSQANQVRTWVCSSVTLQFQNFFALWNLPVCNSRSSFMCLGVCRGWVAGSTFDLFVEQQCHPKQQWYHPYLHLSPLSLLYVTFSISLLQILQVPIHLCHVARGRTDDFVVRYSFFCTAPYPSGVGNRADHPEGEFQIG